MDCSVIFVQCCWAIFTSAHPVPAARSSGSMELNKLPFPLYEQLESAVCIILKMNAWNQQFSFSFFFKILRVFFLFKVENYIKCKALNKETAIKPKYS